MGVSLVNPDKIQPETQAQNGEGKTVGMPREFDVVRLRAVEQALLSETQKQGFDAVGSAGMEDKDQATTFFASFSLSIETVVKKYYLKLHSTNGVLSKHSSVKVQPFGPDYNLLKDGESCTPTWSTLKKATEDEEFEGSPLGQLREQPEEYVAQPRAGRQRRVNNEAQRAANAQLEAQENERRFAAEDDLNQWRDEAEAARQKTSVMQNEYETIWKARVMTEHVAIYLLLKVDGLIEPKFKAALLTHLRGRDHEMGTGEKRLGSDEGISLRAIREFTLRRLPKKMWKTTLTRKVAAIHRGSGDIGDWLAKVVNGFGRLAEHGVEDADNKWAMEVFLGRCTASERDEMTKEGGGIGVGLAETLDYLERRGDQEIKRWGSISKVGEIKKQDTAALKNLFQHLNRNGFPRAAVQAALEQAFPKPKRIEPWPNKPARRGNGGGNPQPKTTPADPHKEPADPRNPAPGGPPKPGPHLHPSRQTAEEKRCGQPAPRSPERGSIARRVASWAFQAPSFGAPRRGA